ncbi:hypothetical protein [Streptomyces sp. YIM 121038]|uniref:hypothetical protein n=1 Tax=Streptomyces sp. YIM 121038 TaxID=2136401 RepID=UPI001110941C|nr:hypothetical protein [Streptomyces sp. YIM 121038]
MSNDEYVKTFGVEQALAEGVPLPGEIDGAGETAALPPDPSIPWYRVNWSTLDWDHNDIPTRQGTNDFGAHHIAKKHNVTSKKFINAPYNGNADRVHGTRAEYDGVITHGSQVRMNILGSAERGEKGPNGVHTPDGRPIGTITSYCKGQTVCPDWVNDI